jgi:MHS family alpha-ketoglutarate permease-like MFS transporter
MAGSSAIIGVCPTYDSIGIVATGVLVLARLTQGFSAGGEYGSATTFMIESSPDDRRGFAGSWQWWAINAGILLSSLIAIATLSMGSSLGLLASGWRIAFIFAGILGLVGLWIRLSVDETAIFKDHQRGAQRRRPVYEIIFKHPSTSLRVIGIAMLGNVTGYIWIILYPSYINATTGLSLRDALTAQGVAVALSLVIIPFLGMLSDRIGRRPILIGFAIASALFAWPSLEWPYQGMSFREVLALECVALVIFSGYCSTVASTMAEQFPTEIRATGIGLPYAIAVTIFGGASPWLVTALKSAGYGHLVWIYVVIVSVVGGAVYAVMPETKGKSIR